MAALMDVDLTECLAGLKDAFQCGDDEEGPLFEALFGAASACASNDEAGGLPVRREPSLPPALIRGLLRGRQGGGGLASPFSGLPASILGQPAAPVPAPQPPAAPAGGFASPFAPAAALQAAPAAAAAAAPLPPFAAAPAPQHQQQAEAEEEERGEAPAAGDATPPKRGRGRPPKASGQYSAAYLARAWQRAGQQLSTQRSHLPVPPALACTRLCFHACARAHLQPPSQQS